MDIYIVGAHSRARTLGTYLMKLYPDIKVEAYLYDNDEPNPGMLEGVPVIRFDENTKLREGCPVYLGTRGEYHPALSAKLGKMGVGEIIPVTPELDRDLRNRFLARYCAENGRAYEKLEDMPAPACIYVARSASDRPLQEGFPLAPFRKEIQAGAALGGKRVCALGDDTGDNISTKNRQFCELTALYWVWKNAGEGIVGLEHYRRHFMLGEGWMQKMEGNRVDVVLPTPLYVRPNIAQNYRDRHVASDWDFMMEYMGKIYPECHKDAAAFFDTNLYSPCNMFIMKKEALDDLCAWLFPVLFACAGHIGEREDAYQNRYPGFLSERLMTFFFEKNHDRYRVVYADKDFLG